jgi:CBS domain-containing protein
MAEQKPFNKELLEAVRFHPFFQGVEVETALSLIDACEYRQYGKNEIMIKKNHPREGLSLVLDGSAEVIIQDEFNEKVEVLEVVQKGELIGFSSLADFLGVGRKDKSDVMVEVRAIDPVCALFIPFDVIAKRWDDPFVRDYLLTNVSIRLQDIYGSLAEQVQLARGFGENDPFMIRVQDVMTTKIVAVTPKMSIKDAAQKMNEEKTSSVLVIENGILKGIITERDMVARVVAKGISLSSTAQDIMTKDPITISRFAYYYDALSLTFLKGIKHLPVVDQSKTLGIVTLSDLLRKKNENVMKTIKKIEEADEHTLPNVKKAIYEVLETLLNENVPMLKTLEIITNLYDRLAVRAVGLAMEKLEEKGYPRQEPFAFYQMGSSGRGEQFMLTDQDHFMVYDSDDHEYFRLLGKEITSYMEKAGYARCKGLMMCSEENWRGPLVVWQERLRKWMLQSTNENLLLAQNFFSYRFIAGSEELNSRLETTVLELLERSKIFLYRLAQVEKEHHIPALDKPIRSLFKLEKKSLDMKKQVLFPYHHCLQILALLNGTPSGTPMEKIDILMKKGVFSQSFADDLKAAANQLLALYVKQRWQQTKKGEKGSSVIHFPRLSTREKEELILSLKTIKELQSQVFAYFSI